MRELPIWGPTTGIMDLDADFEDSFVSEIPGIKTTLRNQKECLKGTNLVSKFIENINQEWAIETGIIEGLHNIECEVMQILIDQGFREELLTYDSINRPRKIVLALLNDQKLA